jgi:APA family basic amino acid/polyamine antiporter
MIGSEYFLVTAQWYCEIYSGWLEVVYTTGLLTMSAVLSYGELAGMMPNAGGQQYV